MRLKTLFLLICIYFGLSTISFGVTNTPTTLVVQAKVAINGDDRFVGSLPMTIGVYESDVDDPALWKETFKSVRIDNGNFTLTIGKSVTLNAELFIKDDLRIGFTPSVNGEPLSTTFIPLKSVPYAFHTQIASKAEKITNEQLLKLDEVNSRVGINNISPQYTLDVGGTVNATTFIGDGSLITNIQVSDDRLVWQKSTANPKNIYYTSGNVGINTKSPSSRLEVSGNAIISGNITVKGTLQAAYLKGNGSRITDLNADQVTNGTLGSERLNGQYPAVTGIGTVTSGTWNASVIENSYISDKLTLNGAHFTGSNMISGNFTVKGPTTIAGPHTMAITTNEWQVSADGDFKAASLKINDQIEITKNSIITTSIDGLHFKPNNKNGLFLSPTGSVGINTITPSTELDVNGGLRLGASSQAVNGVIKFENDRFHGYRDGKWIQLDYEANFESHALHAEGDKIKNLIYINSSGNVGIGGIPSPNITDHLTISGNVVMKGQNLGINLPDINVKGNGTRMFWYPKKIAFRSGYVDNDQWNSENIGVNSVVFGHSGLANAKNTVIIGGQKNKNESPSAVMIGGYNNHIKTGSDFSVTVGGGSSSGAGNLIDGGKYSTIVGGQSHKLSGNYSTIVGGYNNDISGDYSVALGSNITIPHQGSFIFSDGSQARTSTGDNQFIIYAGGNVGIGTPPVSNVALSVEGKVKATFFEGDGSKLTNISATKLNGFAAETQASPNSIYVSNADGFLPENTISGLSIKDGTITSEDIKIGSITGDNIRPYAISTQKIKDGAITEEKIAPGAVTGSKIKKFAISSQNIKDNSIISENIKANSIKEPHIANLQVTNAKIALDTIDSSRILDNTITSKDIGLSEIASFNIESNAIQSHHIEKETVVSDNIAANAIQRQHINELAISSRNIADNSIYTNHIIQYNIENRHITDNAIAHNHIDDAVIINSRIFDNTITSKKIDENAILSIHLPDEVIVTRHIADDAILERHIAAGQIPGSKLADNAIEEANIADNAITEDKLATDSVTTLEIKDETITSKDIGNHEIPGTLIAENAITSKNIAEGGISSSNIELNSITSANIVDFSITSDDIMDGTIQAQNTLNPNSIGSEKIVTGAILNRHIADNAITSRNIEDGTIPWEKITTDPIPNASIADNSISGAKLKDNSIDGSKIKDGSITVAKLADKSISTNALVGTLAVSKGGTGISNFNDLVGAVLFGVDNGTSKVMGGDKTKLHWDNANNRLGINTASPAVALHIKGDLLTEGGSLYLGNKNNSISYGSHSTDNTKSFIIIGPPASGTIDETTEPNGALKTKQLYVKEKVGIGVMEPKNKLEVKGSMAIGADYAGKQAPANGLIVEGAVAIGKTAPTAGFMLDVEGRIKAKGIFGESTDTTSGVGIMGIGGSKGIVSEASDIGVEIKDAKSIGLTTSSSTGKGISVVINNTSSVSAQGLLVEHKDTAGTVISSGGIGKFDSSKGYTAAVFGTAGTDANATNWAGYFDGPVKITNKLGIGLGQNDTPEADLHVKKSALIESTIGTSAAEPLSGTAIKWHEKSKWVIKDCNTPKQLTFNTGSGDTELPNGSYILTLIVESKADTCVVTFSESSIKWEKGQVPSNTDAIKKDNFAIFSFLLKKESNTDIVYYGMGPANFK